MLIAKDHPLPQGFQMRLVCDNTDVADCPLAGDSPDCRYFQFMQRRLVVVDLVEESNAIKGGLKFLLQPGGKRSGALAAQDEF